MDTVAAVVVVLVFYVLLGLIALRVLKFCHECDEDIAKMLHSGAEESGRKPGKKWWAQQSE